MLYKVTRCLLSRSGSSPREVVLSYIDGKCTFMGIALKAVYSLGTLFSRK
jgi:hypothetical protein